MNIHEYQAKALLAKFGVPLLKGGVAYTPDEADGRGPQARRPGLGGEGADPCRRPRQGPLQGRSHKGGVRIAKSIEEVGQHAARHARHELVTKQTGPAGKIVKRLYIEDGCDITRELYSRMLVDRAIAASPSWPRPRAAWTSRRWRHDHPEKIVKEAIDPAAGFQAYPRPQDRLRAGPERQGGRRVRQAHGRPLQGLRRARLLAGRDQPAGRHRRGRGDRARRQDELRRQRAVPPQGARGAARRRRGGSGRDRGRQVRAELHQARRQHRLHGERRRPGHGDHGHHQALRRRARQLPRRRRRRHQGARDRRLQDHPQRPQRRGHPGQHLRRHHALRRDRRGRGRRGARGQPARAAGGAARRHQRRARQEDPEANPA